MEGNPDNILEKQKKAYESVKKFHLKHGAEMDEDNGSIIRKSKRTEKMNARLRDGNVALEVDRPVLPTVTFEDLKAGLLRTADEKDAYEKPQPKFLEILEKENME